MTVRMRHPELPEDQQIDVFETAVPMHRAAGWVVVEEPEPEPKADDPAPILTPPAAAEASPELTVRKSRRAASDKEND
ncbi:hypothetical protein [Streptomyces sp. NPDC001268]|uniref:hypothetical protein n=1 Tax=Streptomyces sp. NPDC001268 TaxID=3364553 RepID=UPI00369FDFF3